MLGDRSWASGGATTWPTTLVTGRRRRENGPTGVRLEQRCSGSGDPGGGETGEDWMGDTGTHFTVSRRALPSGAARFG
jgi:hypothetical protein